MDNVVMHIADVHKNFAGLKALSDVDLQVEESKTHAIIGPNGAGKSTLLNVIIGRLEPDAGAVIFDGKVITGMEPHLINQMGIARVFQTPEIFPDLNLLENVMVPAFAKVDGSFKLNPMSALTKRSEVRDMAAHVLEDVGLKEHIDEEAGALSRGDKRRLELAMCLVQKPRMLLLDEPTAGMSRLETNRTIDLLQKIKDRGMTKVIIEHDMHVVFSLADRITVLAQGKIIADGAPEEIKGNPVVQEAYLGGAH